MPFSWGSGEGAGERNGYFEGLGDREATRAQVLAHALAFQELGDDVGQAVMSTDVVDGQDVGVIEGSGGSGFTLEAFEPLAVA